MEAKALAFWYDQIRRDKSATPKGANDAKEFPPDAEIAATDHAGYESASIIAPAQQLVLQPAAITPKLIVDQGSTRTTAQRKPAATTKISNKSPQRPPHKWHSSGFRVKRARWVLLSKHGRRIQRKIFKRYGVKVRRAKEDCIYFEGPDQRAIARAEAEFFWRIWSPLSLLLA